MDKRFWHHLTLYMTLLMLLAVPLRGLALPYQADHARDMNTMPCHIEHTAWHTDMPSQPCCLNDDAWFQECSHCQLSQASPQQPPVMTGLPSYLELAFTGKTLLPLFHDNLDKPPRS